MHKIPTISYNDLKNTDKEVLEFLTLSLENNGFFVINNHPVDLKLISNAFKIAEEMFNLPFDTNKNIMYQALMEQEVTHHMVLKLHLMKKLQIKKNFGIKALLLI